MKKVLTGLDVEVSLIKVLFKMQYSMEEILMHERDDLKAMQLRRAIMHLERTIEAVAEYNKELK